MSQKDKQLLEKYWSKYSKRIYVYIGTLVGYDKEIREDLVQTVYVKAFQNINSLLPGSSPVTWLIAIARNTAIDYLRFKERERNKNNSFIFITDMRYISAEQEAETEIDRQTLRLAIKKLPAQLSEVLYLRFYEEMSFRTMSKIMGISIGTLKSRVFKAKQELKRILEVDYGFYATR